MHLVHDRELAFLKGSSLAIKGSPLTQDVRGNFKSRILFDNKIVSLGVDLGELVLDGRQLDGKSVHGLPASLR